VYFDQSRNNCVFKNLFEKNKKKRKTKSIKISNEDFPIFNKNESLDIDDEFFNKKYLLNNNNEPSSVIWKKNNALKLSNDNTKSRTSIKSKNLSRSLSMSKIDCKITDESFISVNKYKNENKNIFNNFETKNSNNIFNKLKHDLNISKNDLKNSSSGKNIKNIDKLQNRISTDKILKSFDQDEIDSYHKCNKNIFINFRCSRA
jgi:hypothetical protein